MSLVVARSLPPEGLTFLADTKLTVHEVGRPPGEGCLKIIIPRRDLCIAFAGAVEPAGAAIASLPSSANHARVLEHLLSAHISCGGRTDFLVGDGSGGLSAIRDGSATSAGAAWVGNHDAFRDFQALVGQMEREPADQPQDSHGRAWHAFDRLVSSGVHDSVGHFTVEAGFWPGDGYKYRWRWHVHQERLPPLPPGVSVEVDWGNAETGSFGMEAHNATTADDPSGRCTLALYFPFAGFGYVYLPAQPGEVPTPHVVVGAPADFTRSCRARFGLVVGPE